MTQVNKRAPTLTAPNIVAILTAAAKGGTQEEIVARAGIEISTASLNKWLKDGKKDLKEERQTAYAIFTEQWNTVYPGAPPRHEALRIEEMKKALADLGIERQCPNPAPAPGARAPAPKNICQCGNEKEPKDEACQSCEAKDRRSAAA